MAMALVVLTGCLSHNEDEISYMGEYPELYSVAISTLLGAEGQIYSEVPMEASLKMVEEDNYGRKLFIYYEERGITEYSLLISQKSNEEYVYFYPDYNFIMTSQEMSDIGLRFTDERIFLPEEIEKLKEDNDWNKEINIERCTKVKIVREKEGGPIEYKVLELVYNELLGDERYVAKYSMEFLIADNYSRSIYAFYGKNGDYVIVLLQPDGSYDEVKSVMKLRQGNYKYQDELKELKELNSWNEPI